MTFMTAKKCENVVSKSHFIRKVLFMCNISINFATEMMA